MLKYTIERFLAMILTLFIIATATFFLLQAVPGDPLVAKTERLSAEQRDRMYAKYGLDKPVMERYIITMKGFLVGDFGESITFPGQTVWSIAHEKLPISARLGIQQMLLGITVGLALGIIAAMKKGSWPDYVVITLSILLISIPNLVFGLMLQYLFAGGIWKVFPTIGWPSGSELWTGGWEFTILPTLTGCFGYIASYARLLKTSMLDVINQDYIMTAESKGLSQRKIIFRHVLRNSFIPVLTNLPMSVVMCITGSFFVERIFSIPGIGMYYTTAVQGRDLAVVLGWTVLIAAMMIIVIYITDILYTLVDPRIRLRGGKR